MDRFYECFSDIGDPRADNCQHPLLEVLFIALLAVLCGAKHFTEMEEFGLAKEDLLRQILTLKHGPPSHDTFNRVFRDLDPQGFDQAFRRFMAVFAEAAGIGRPKGVVALDGKALRRAYERGQSYMPKVMVQAWASETRMVLASRLADDNNEAGAALQLIDMLQLKRCVVTADALHCHRAMAERIVQRGGDYVLAVKDNQPALLREAMAAVTAVKTPSSASTQERSHGRDEGRTAVVVPAGAMGFMHDFPKLAAIGRIESCRNGKSEMRYFLCSKRFTPERLLQIVRSHWDIENGLHWALDVAFDEDLARTRKHNGPANFAILRRLAINIARAHPNKRMSLQRKLLRAGWDEAFLFDLIRHMR